MAGETGWSHRACCATSAACGRNYGFTEPSEASPVLSSVGAPVLIENMPRPARTPGLAFHEAGHAVIWSALGIIVESAKIGGSDSVTSIVPPGVPHSAIVGGQLAGEIAEWWRDGVVWRRHEHELTWLYRRCLNLDVGNCDNCRAMLHIVAEDLSRPESGVIARWREIEAQMIRTIQRIDVWHSIIRVAETLLEHGEIDTKTLEVLAKCEQFTLT